MLHAIKGNPWRQLAHSSCSNARMFTTSTRALLDRPNPPLNLDPSLKALLRDVDMSLVNHKTNSAPSPRELEVLRTFDSASAVALNPTGGPEEEISTRKSPAAHFGSQHIGAVVLPNQLQETINLLISETDKPQLHSDAKRLFSSAETNEGSERDWETLFDVRYRSRQQATRHSERDGTAFASVALPAHYAAIASVLDHVKRRLEPRWRIEHVVDWGAGTGSGLWASLYSFQAPQSNPENGAEDLQIADSTVRSYLGIDKRDGLTTIGKRLLRNVETGNLSISWKKSFKEEDHIHRTRGDNVLALSAFMLTALPTPLARKTLVKEMWESGAHVIVLVDHNTPTGFEAIAEAREYLLNMGRKELEDPEIETWPIRGSHVVAPCPHDAACPLHHPGPSKLVCGFTQRLQRPAFIRRTKHSGIGQEDIEYSYVVIRRGVRPTAAMTTVGRVGVVGRRALEQADRSRDVMKELMLHDDRPRAIAAPEPLPVSAPVTPELLPGELDEALRREAYSWPRLVFPPLKKSGHIILDSCTAEGKIMRLTIPKSQGKQAFYDARKSSWGDIFPHPPKNPAQERHQPTRQWGFTPAKGSDIGKRKGSDKLKARITYEGLSNDLKETRKKSRRDRTQESQLDD